MIQLRERIRSSVALRRAHAWTSGYLHALGRCRATGLAAELAFWLFLSLLPLAAVVGLIAARLAMKDAALLMTLTTTVPRASRDLLFGELSRVSAWNSGAVGPVAAVVFVWLASSGIHAIFDAIELSSRAPARSWLHKRALSIASCVVLSSGAALTVALQLGFGALHRLAHPHALDVVAASFVGTLMRGLISTALTVAMVAGVFAVGLPRGGHRKMRVLPGAIAATFAHLAMGFGYAVFLSRTGDGGAYQAGLAVIGVTLTALYLGSLSLLMGATLNHYLAEA